MYVGEITAPSTPIACAIPLASTVFPAPSGPDSTTTSPARRSAPRRAPNVKVSSAVGSVAALSSPTAADLVPQPPRERDKLRRRRPHHQPHEGVVDDLGAFQLHEMPGTGNDHQLALRH